MDHHLKAVRLSVPLGLLHLYGSRNTGYRKIILGIYRYIPAMYHTSGIYRYLGVSFREAVRKVLKG